MIGFQDFPHTVPARKAGCFSSEELATWIRLLRKRADATYNPEDKARDLAEARAYEIALLDASIRAYRNEMIADALRERIQSDA